MKVVNGEAPKFDPSKKYQWDPNAGFVLSGNEFGLLINALRASLNTKEAQQILLLDKASEALESVFERAVESGVAVEVVDENKSSL